MLPPRLCFIGLQLLTLSYTAQSLVMLSANSADVKKLARKFVSESLADKIAEFLAISSGKIADPVSNEDDLNEIHKDNAVNVISDAIDEYELHDRDVNKLIHTIKNLNIPPLRIENLYVTPQMKPNNSPDDSDESLLIPKVRTKPPRLIKKHYKLNRETQNPGKIDYLDRELQKEDRHVQFKEPNKQLLHPHKVRLDRKGHLANADIRLLRNQHIGKLEPIEEESVNIDKQSTDRKKIKKLYKNQPKQPNEDLSYFFEKFSKYNKKQDDFGDFKQGHIRDVKRDRNNRYKKDQISNPEHDSIENTKQDNFGDFKQDHIRDVKRDHNNSYKKDQISNSEHDPMENTEQDNLGDFKQDHIRDVKRDRNDHSKKDQIRNSEHESIDNTNQDNFGDFKQDYHRGRNNHYKKDQTSNSEHDPVDNFKQHKFEDFKQGHIRDVKVDRNGYNKKDQISNPEHSPIDNFKQDNIDNLKPKNTGTVQKDYIDKFERDHFDNFKQDHSDNSEQDPSFDFYKGPIYGTEREDSQSTNQRKPQSSANRHHLRKKLFKQKKLAEFKQLDKSEKIMSQIRDRLKFEQDHPQHKLSTTKPRMQTEKKKPQYEYEDAKTLNEPKKIKKLYHIGNDKLKPNVEEILRIDNQYLKHKQVHHLEPKLGKDKYFKTDIDFAENNDGIRKLTEDNYDTQSSIIALFLTTKDPKIEDNVGENTSSLKQTEIMANSNIPNLSKSKERNVTTAKVENWKGTKSTMYHGGRVVTVEMIKKEDNAFDAKKEEYNEFDAKTKSVSKTEATSGNMKLPNPKDDDEKLWVQLEKGMNEGPTSEKLRVF